LAVTHQAHYLEDIESWIFRLDKANTASGGGVNVYKVQHADAKKLAATLTRFLPAPKTKIPLPRLRRETADTMSNQDPTNTDNAPSGTGSSPFGTVIRRPVWVIRYPAIWEPSLSISLMKFIGWHSGRLRRQ